MHGRITLGLIAAAMVALACAPPAAAPGSPAAPAAAAGSPAAPAAAAPTTAAAPTASSGAEAPPPPQSMRYGYVPILAAGPMYIAKERGYFAEQGIDLEMQSFDSGALLIPA